MDVIREHDLHARRCRKHDPPLVNDMSKWFIPELAPKDGKEILVMCDAWPNQVVAMWNEAKKSWVVARPSCDLYKGEWNDYYFENEFHVDKIYCWTPIPEPPQKKPPAASKGGRLASKSPIPKPQEVSSLLGNRRVQPKTKRKASCVKTSTKPSMGK